MCVLFTGVFSQPARKKRRRACSPPIRDPDDGFRVRASQLEGDPIACSRCSRCVPPGAKLLLCDIPVSIQEQLGVAAIEEVIFTQKSAESFMYRDAVRFANGQEILIQCLRRGQRVQVLSLADEEDEHESKNGTSVSAAHW